MPDFVARALAKEKLTEAYRARPPYQQNDYVGWIARAKREETQQKRLRQMLDELKDGTRYMNMKYRPKIAMTPEDFRALALALPDVVESSHMSHPDFRVGGKIFASLGAPSVAWSMVKLTPEQQAEALTLAPDALRPAAGAWGRQGYTSVFLALAKKAVVKALLKLAAANIRAAHPPRAYARPR